MTPFWCQSKMDGTSFNGQCAHKKQRSLQGASTYDACRGKGSKNDARNFLLCLCDNWRCRQGRVGLDSNVKIFVYDVSTCQEFRIPPDVQRTVCAPKMGCILWTARMGVNKTGRFRVARHILYDWHNPSTGQDDRNQPHGKNSLLNVWQNLFCGLSKANNYGPKFNLCTWFGEICSCCC